MLPLDVGKVYSAIERDDPCRSKFGFIPAMASSSYAQIGALNAESFCERVLRAAGQVMTDGNTLLDDEELEMLAILRVNRDFMERMRTRFAHLKRERCSVHLD